MPLLDHFHPPLSASYPWMGFHSTWATAMAQQLNRELLPEDYYAIPNVQLGGQVEIDVATLKGGIASPDAAAGSGPGGVATAVWAPPKPSIVLPVDFGDIDVFEVQVLRDFGGPQLRAAVELVSPANKDRPGQRRAFAIKCASYLQRGVSVVVIDVVTERTADLHAELMQMLNLAQPTPSRSPSNLYAVAYRTALSNGGTPPRLEAWPEPLRLNGPLPTLPLWIDVDLPVPLQLEESYLATCESLRIRA
jgi:hypothetical protein